MHIITHVGEVLYLTSQPCKMCPLTDVGGTTGTHLERRVLYYTPTKKFAPKSPNQPPWSLNSWSLVLVSLVGSRIFWRARARARHGHGEIIKTRSYFRFQILVGKSDSLWIGILDSGLLRTNSNSRNSEIQFGIDDSIQWHAKRPRPTMEEEVRVRLCRPTSHS